MENFEKYQRIQLVRKEACQSPEGAGKIVLTADEETFLSELLAMPESWVFLEETFRKELQEKIGSCRENVTERLGEFQISGNWDDEEYIRNAKLAMEIVRRNVDFQYQNRTLYGGVRKGWGCPIAIQVDMFTREWYMNFIDVDSRVEVLANLSRLTFSGTGESASFSREEKRIIKEGSRNQKLTLAVKNEKGAIERACALFALKQRFMRYDRDTDEMVMEIAYCDYEKDEMISNILSLEDLAVVREPRELREELLLIVEGMLELYE